MKLGYDVTLLHAVQIFFYNAIKILNELANNEEVISI